MTGCAFCQIVSGSLTADIVLRDEACLAFLDKRPLFPGHVLLIPRRHYQTLPEVPPEQAAALMRNTQLLSRAVESALEAEGTFIAVNNRVSQSVPHVHVHVVPRRKKDGLKGFFWPRYKYQGEEEMIRTREAIVAALDPSPCTC